MSNVGPENVAVQGDGGWTPYFSHAANYSEHFQKPIVNWFRLWGHELNPLEPTEVDMAIAQTNMFVGGEHQFTERVLNAVTHSSSSLSVN